MNSLEIRIANARRFYGYRKEYLLWLVTGKPVPPPHFVKQLAIRRYGKIYSLSTLIETGTFQGDMVVAQRSHFKRIISIELSRDHFERAKGRFKNDPNIEILPGDSGVLLKEIVPTLSQPSLFWLDGHYSGGNTAKGGSATPILKELETIFASKVNHVVLIDDARLFSGSDDYPTIGSLKALVTRNGWEISVLDDIIRVTRNTKVL
jgi:hypothetical protein